MKRKIQEFLAKWIAGPVAILVGISIAYSWMFEGTYWTLLGFIPITPLLFIAITGAGLYICKLAFIDKDMDKLLKFLDEE